MSRRAIEKKPCVGTNRRDYMYPPRRNIVALENMYGVCALI